MRQRAKLLVHIWFIKICHLLQLDGGDCLWICLPFKHKDTWIQLWMHFETCEHLGERLVKWTNILAWTFDNNTPNKASHLPPLSCPQAYVNSTFKRKQIWIPSLIKSLANVGCFWMPTLHISIVNITYYMGILPSCPKFPSSTKNQVPQKKKKIIHSLRRMRNIHLNIGLFCSCWDHIFHYHST